MARSYPMAWDRSRNVLESAGPSSRDERTKIMYVPAVLIFSSGQSAEYKQFIDLRAGSYVFAGPEEPNGGPFKLHTARCMHVNANKTARLIAPGELRIVARTARDLYGWLGTTLDRSMQRTAGCQSCKTGELVERHSSG